MGRTKAVGGKGIKKSGLHMLIEMGRIHFSRLVFPAPGPLDLVELLLIYTHSSGTGSLPFFLQQNKHLLLGKKNRGILKCDPQLSGNSQ